MHIIPRFIVTLVKLIPFLVLLSVVGCGNDDATYERAKAIMYEVDERIQSQIASTQSFLSRTANTQLGKNVAQCQEQLAEQVKLYRVHSAGVALPDGRVICDSPKKSGLVVYDKSYFKRALLNASVTVGDYEGSAWDDKPITGYAYPLHDVDGQLVGVIFVEEKFFEDIDWLNRLLEARGARTAEIVMLDSRGTIFAAVPEQTKWRGQSLAAQPLGQAMLAQPEGKVEATGLDGIPRIYAFTSPIWAQGNWHIALGIRK